MRAAAILLLALLHANTAIAADKKPSPTPDKGSCLPAGSDKPIFEVEADWGNHKMPLKLRVLGFSSTGRIALLEQRQGEEPGGLWFLRIVDLKRDRLVAEREFETKELTTAALCRAHSAAIRGVLAKYEVQTSQLPTLLPFPVAADCGAVALELKRGSRAEGTTRHEVWLKEDKNSKRLGVLREFAVESGRDPVGPPSVIGALRSPWEPRLAVLIRQDETEMEGAIAPLIRVMGAQLDAGWTSSGP